MSLSSPTPLASVENHRFGQDRLGVVWREGEGPTNISPCVVEFKKEPHISFFLSCRPQTPTRASMGSCGTAFFTVSELPYEGGGWSPCSWDGTASLGCQGSGR